MEEKWGIQKTKQYVPAWYRKCDLGKNIESQAGCERPSCDQEKLKKGEYEQRTFHPVKEASDFWKLFWEQEGSGDPSAPWLGVLKEAIKENVSEPREDGITFKYTSARKVITKKNWSAPGPDKIANFWWKNDVPYTRAFVRKQTSRHSLVVYGRYNIINSKARSIFQRKSVPDHLLKYHLQVVSSCLLKPMNHHLEKYGLMEREQRGTREKCSGTFDNLLIDRMVCQDSQSGKRNLSMLGSMLERPLTR